jgi:hypothetical protein
MSIQNNQFATFKAQLDQTIAQSGMTFNPSIDCRNDLVNFYGYTRSQVNAMSDDELFHIMDQIEDQEEGYSEPEYNLINIPCNSCKHPQMLEVDFSDWNDCYSLQCPECKREREIHYTVYDAILEEYMEAEQQPEPIQETVTPVKAEIDTRLLDDIDFSVRTYNCLKRAGYDTVQQVKDASYVDMCRVRNLGRNSLNEIQEKLNITFE